MDTEIEDLKLSCKECGREYYLKDLYYRCIECGSPLDVSKTDRYNYLEVEEAEGIFRYSRHLISGVPHTTLGEGMTPLHKLDEGSRKLFFKLEYLNPSGSFKDRGAALTIAVAKSLGVKEVNEDSSGNAGTAIALYATAYGIKPNIFMPENAPQNKKILVKLFGGNLVLGRDRGEANRLAIEDSMKRGIYYVGHVWNPFFILALKTVAYETYEVGIIPDEVFVPVGSGGLFLGVYYGFLDLQRMGLIDRIPRIHTVEAAGYDRIYLKRYGVEKYPGETSELADGLRVPGPPRIKEILDALGKCRGESIVVNDVEIRDALRNLYKMGLFVEPTSATAYAAYLSTKNSLERDIDILIPLTGSGFKALDKVGMLFPG